MSQPNSATAILVEACTARNPNSSGILCTRTQATDTDNHNKLVRVCNICGGI
jgi:hypothetical protein